MVENGIRLEFDQIQPLQTSIPRQYQFSKIEHEAIVKEIDKLRQKGVIKIVRHTYDEFVSNIFVRPKKDGDYRMILNLENVNECIKYHKFKMSTLKSAVNLITPGCFLATIDWKDAYYSVKIHQKFRKLLRFKFEDVLYEFQVLPNGIASGPRLFTKITKPIFSQLRKWGFINSPYIDDCLIIGDTQVECRENVRKTIELSCKTGFVVHPTKSKFEPTQEIEFLGFVINSTNMTLKVNNRQVDKIIDACKTLSSETSTTILHVAKVVGLLVASFPGVKAGPLYYRRLDNAKNSAIKLNKGNFYKKMTITSDLKRDLRWWIENIMHAYKPINKGNPDLTTYSRACICLMCTQTLV